MRNVVIACSMLALSLTLTGCDSSSSSSRSGATAKNARWNDTTAKQLREAIGRRAAHGLDHMRFEVPEGGRD